MFQLDWSYTQAEFKQPAKTSRDVLLKKPSWILHISKGKGKNQKKGIGEVSIIPGLSPEDPNMIAEILGWAKYHTRLPHEKFLNEFNTFPAVRFGLEMAIRNMKRNGNMNLFSTPFTKGVKSIPTNGLIWMGNQDYMWNQALKKVTLGHKCIKLKIGGIALEQELEILKKIRSRFKGKNIEIRLDANGAFTPDQALDILKEFSQFNIHSIEQPIAKGNWDAMEEICAKSPIPVALDEELIGIYQTERKEKLLDKVKPQFVILKPSMLGGWQKCNEWIAMAKKRKIGWWATSALEMNIGLNAISQWVATHKPTIAQGLGTGELFRNNQVSPMFIKNGGLWYHKDGKWDIPENL